jgi:hypothetical protein
MDVQKRTILNVNYLHKVLPADNVNNLIHAVFIYINDLSLGLNIDIKLLLYADDTSVLTSGDNMQEIQTKSSHVLNSLNNGLQITACL